MILVMMNLFILQGKKKENGKHYYGSHWVIPSIKTNTKSIKLHLKELNEKYGDVIDLSVYKAGLLRLPYQTTKEKPYRHTLPYRNKDAEIKHFLIHNTIDCDIELYEDDSDNSKYNSITQNLGDVIPSTKLNYDLLEELSDEFHNGYENWRNMCFFMKNLNYPYDDFLRLSKGPTSVSDMKCFSQWNSTRIKDGITEAYFYSRLKQTKPDVFENMKASSKSKHNLPIKTKFIDESKIINVSQRYLIALDNVNLDDEDEVITSNINQFFESPNKSLSVKSPYDTGKTKLLSKIFTKYDPKRILWLSYRKTLSNDILG